MKVCSICDKTLDAAEFPRASARCRACYNAVYVRKYKSAYSQCLVAYGGQCAACGENDKSKLAIDHVNNDGGSYRARSTRSVALLLASSGFPQGYQILCYNCNWKKRLSVTPRSMSRKACYMRSVRDSVLQRYGGACAACGLTDRDCLSIDHIMGGGPAHRRQINRVELWLIRNDFPEGFQVLCMNCNISKYRMRDMPIHRINA
jgi:hypothetical protein